MSDIDSLPGTPLPEAGNDSGNPERPMSEERDTPPPPAASPGVGIDDQDNEAALSDESDLSEVDEAEFADFDPTNVALEDRPLIDIDEDVAKTLKASKRRRADGEGKKLKEGKREKKKKSRRVDDDEMPDGEEIDGKRIRKPKRIEGERKDRSKEPKKAAPEPENEEHLTPQERRRRALDRMIDASLKNPNKNKRRKKKDEEDIENAFDEEIAALKIRMEEACTADNTAREKGDPAINKLKMLPEVVAMLNRTELQSMILDPETNFLQSVKYYMEPLNDGSLPAYNIQRDLFAALSRLPIEREALLSSGIGKLVLYYTKSKKPELGIKRQAERLLSEWSRPILRRSDDYKKRKIATREFDFHAARLALRQSGGASSSQAPSSQRTARDIQRERELASMKKSNRAQLGSGVTNYTIAPRSTFDPAKGDHMDPNSRPIGASGVEAFRKMTLKRGKKRS